MLTMCIKLTTNILLLVTLLGCDDVATRNGLPSIQLTNTSILLADLEFYLGKRVAVIGYIPEQEATRQIFDLLPSKDYTDLETVSR